MIFFHELVPPRRIEGTIYTGVPRGVPEPPPVPEWGLPKTPSSAHVTRDKGLGQIEGRRKKKNEDLRTYTRSDLKKAPTHLFFFFFIFSEFFYCVFRCFSAWGTQKQRKKLF